MLSVNKLYKTNVLIKSRHPSRKTLARRIRLLRTLRSWSQEVLAKLAWLHRTYIGALERGEGTPCPDNIEKIAMAFEVPVRTLLDERLENLFNQDIDQVEKPRAVYDNGTIGNVIPLVLSEKRLDTDLAAGQNPVAPKVLPM